MIRMNPAHDCVTPAGTSRGVAPPAGTSRVVVDHPYSAIRGRYLKDVIKRIQDDEGIQEAQKELEEHLARVAAGQAEKRLQSLVGALRDLCAAADTARDARTDDWLGDVVLVTDIEELIKNNA